MPFTLAHPAAALPLGRVLGRRAVLSALVIGSVVPDFWYLMPFGLKRADTHGVAGLFWFCLPVGLAVYLIYHAVMKQPLLELLPRPLATRLAACGAGEAGLPAAAWLAVLASLGVGTLTHLVWDAVTHDGSFVQHAVPALDAALFSVGAYKVHGYSLLQHLSTLGGTGLLVYWGYRWFRTAPVGRTAAPRFSRAARTAMLCAVAVALAWIVLGVLAAVWRQTLGVPETRQLAKVAFGEAGAAAALALFAYGLGWHALGVPRGAQRRER